MPTQPKLEPKHFFEAIPSFDHRTGDIWRGLPSFGMLGTSTLNGIVITPACDLANRKTETITYLPIVSVSDYLRSTAYCYECWLELQTALVKLKCADKVTAPDRYENADVDEIKKVCMSLSNTQRETAAGKQLLAYATYVADCTRGEIPSLKTIEQLLTTKRLNDALCRIIANALKTDIHFLPADGRPAEYSALEAHSVVLFRYPLSIPTQILDAAQRVTPDAWEEMRVSLRAQYPVAAHFSRWPVKLSALKSDFLSDLLSRYVSTYIRLGSRDFTAESLVDISEQVRGN